MILRVNALGIVYMNEEFSNYMDSGVIVDVASNFAYVLCDGGTTNGRHFKKR